MRLTDRIGREATLSILRDTRLHLGVGLSKALSTGVYYSNSLAANEIHAHLLEDFFEPLVGGVSLWEWEDAAGRTAEEQEELLDEVVRTISEMDTWIVLPHID